MISCLGGSTFSIGAEVTCLVTDSVVLEVLTTCETLSFNSEYSEIFVALKILFPIPN